jgi:uncharacterized damage-inducible protein DinB
MQEERKAQTSPSELELLKEWYAYNSFVRKKYLQEIFEKLPEEERYKDRGASFPSVVDIFMHIIDAYRSWFIYTYEDRWSEFERLRGKKKYTKEEVEAEEEKLDTLLNNFLNALTEDDLPQWIAFKGRVDFRKIRLRDMLWHMVEEDLQHRGELNALFWQLNIDPPVTGWNPFDEDKEQISEEEYRKIKGEST